MNKKKLRSEKNILTDPMVEPNVDILEKVLEKNYKFYEAFVKKINKLNLVPEWNFYNDTKSWLCRILKDKKNYGWLSILDLGIKLTVYFTKDTINSIYQMDINENIKELAKDMEIGRKNPPVNLFIENKNSLNDAIKILEYRIGI